jgi:hypothetical protein
MRQFYHSLTVGFVILAGLLAACTSASPAPEKILPAKVDKEHHQVTLTEKAAERLGIQTDIVREDTATRTRQVGGLIVTSANGIGPAPGQVWVQVSLTDSDFALVDRGEPAIITSLEDDEEDSDANALEGEPDEGPTDDAEEGEAAGNVLYYAVDNADNRFTPGQRVFVEVTLSGSGTVLKVIPYATVIYDTSGGTWVYTNPQPLVFIRESIEISYIEDDRVFLTAGPAVGTVIVTVGGSELYGAEVGVAK